METSSKPKRFRFTIRLLFLLIAATGFILSLYYPRIHCEVEIDCAAANRTEALRHCRTAKSAVILTKAIEGLPNLDQEATSDSITWLRERIETTPTDKNLIRIRVVGKPTERKEVEQMANAVAKSLMEFIDPISEKELLDLVELERILDQSDLPHKQLGVVQKFIREIKVQGLRPEPKIVSINEGWGR